MQKLPGFLKQYFWDVDFKSIDLQKSKILILKRILEIGDIKAVKWLIKHYSKEDIKNLILTSDDLTPKTANFWAFYLQVDPKKIPALKKPRSKRKQIPLTSEYLIRSISRPGNLSEQWYNRLINETSGYF